MRRCVVYGLLLLLILVDARIFVHRKRRHSLRDEPFCGESANIQGELEMEKESNFSSPYRIFSTQFNLALDSTICIRLQNMVHVIKYESLEQSYAIENSYTFALPQIDTTCKCDCAAGTDFCSVSQYGDDRNCATSDEYPTCFTKYHSDVAATDCALHSMPAKACCEVRLKPYKGQLYRAVRLHQPISNIVLSYSIYANTTGRLLKVYGPQHQRVLLNKGKEEFELNEHHRIAVSLTAPPPHLQLPHGMYYFPEGTEDMKMAKINEINEGNLERLGWFKKTNNDWSVDSNGLMLRNAFKMVMNSCKGQNHTDQFAGANYYVLRGKEYIDNYGEKRVTDMSYVRKVKIDEVNREVTVTHHYGTAASLYLKTDTRPNLTKSQSLLQNFTGMISLDHDGNRMLNLTLFGVKGTVHIKLYENDRKSLATFACTAQFGTNVKDDSSRISLPSTISQAQFICILADEQPQNREICKWIPYEERSMKLYTEKIRWSAGHSPCSLSECNNLDRTASEWVPWFFQFDYFASNVKGFDEWIKMAIHMAICGVCVLVLILIITKCLIPLACCSLSIPFARSKGKK